MPSSTWNRLLPWLFAAAIAANLWELATLTVLPWNGDTGLAVQYYGSRMQPVRAIDGPAAAAGFRIGDVVDMRELSAANGFANPVPGVPYKLIAHRGRQKIVAAIEPAAVPLDAGEVVRFVAVFWLIAFAGLIAVRGARSRENRLLLLVLLAWALESALVRIAWPDGRLAFATQTLGAVPFNVACIALALYASTFGPALSVVRRALLFATCGAAIFDFVSVVVVWSVVDLYPWTDLNSGIAGALTFGGIFIWLGLLTALLCVAAAIPAAQRQDRQRLAWVLVSFVPFLVGVVAGNLHPWSTDPIWWALQNASFFFIPAGLTYAALAKRMFDLGFIVNRAVVFAGVSIVVVGAFVLLEWALGRWFEDVSHATSLAVNAGLALALGLSIRFVHAKIDGVVDNVFFRKRHENETVLRRFAREAGFFTDSATLLERTRTTILAHSEVTTVDLVMARALDPNDAAVVAMRAWHDPVDLTACDTSLRGEMAFPMLAHGTLVGAIVCGPKRTGERYAPDELESLEAVAHGVGLALDGLDRSAPDGTALAQIAAMFAAISARLDQLAPKVSR